MKILFLSDIHANFEALYMLDEIIKKSDKVICLGDIIGYYCQVNEVIDYLKANQVICILGNHDQMLLSDKYKEANDSVRFGIEYAKQVITVANYNWLKHLPLIYANIYDGRRMLCIHGSPWDPLEEYIYDNREDRIDQLKEFEFEVIAFGHTHRAYEKYFNRDRIVLNPGSVGQSRDSNNMIKAKILDTQMLSIESINIPYNPKQVLHIAVQHGAREWIFKHHQ
jgi:putative phosphoesterase